ncbi:hypothetical protein KQX54_018429 [Cotesia glomerata]|uniref:Uncharacterized protein n=1 Tax=Cotesia glomerata TaxID=32391 RepID=A0AAV7ISY5_COTGL|nr:hypothetical protein KQX54_018429 [Cotesia glomerata]
MIPSKIVNAVTLTIPLFHGSRLFNKFPGWLSGWIIDIYTASHIDTWLNNSYFPTDVSSKTISVDVGEDKPKRLSSASSIAQIKEPLCDIILMPYLFSVSLALLECIERGISMDENLVPAKLRREMARAILRTSEDMKDCCLYCRIDPIPKFQLRSSFKLMVFANVGNRIQAQELDLELKYLLDLL